MFNLLLSSEESKKYLACEQQAGKVLKYAQNYIKFNKKNINVRDSRVAKEV